MRPTSGSFFSIRCEKKTGEKFCSFVAVLHSHSLLVMEKTERLSMGPFAIGVLFFRAERCRYLFSRSREGKKLKLKRCDNSNYDWKIALWHQLLDEFRNNFYLQWILSDVEKKKKQFKFRPRRNYCGQKGWQYFSTYISNSLQLIGRCSANLDRPLATWMAVNSVKRIYSVAEKIVFLTLSKCMRHLECSWRWELWDTKQSNYIVWCMNIEHM